MDVLPVAALDHTSVCLRLEMMQHSGGQMGWKQLGEQRAPGGTLLTYKEFDEECAHV